MRQLPVVPVTDPGEQHVPEAPGTEVVDSMQVDRMDYMQREMVRRNQWIFQEVGEPGYLMYRRAGGTCGCTTTETRTPPRHRQHRCVFTSVLGHHQSAGRETSEGRL